MTTFRVATRRRFANIDRRSVNDDRLSFRARGLLVWLLDKPDDWRFDAETISRSAPEGRDAIRKALGELTQAGYIARRKVRGDGGRLRTDTFLYEHPSEAPGAENPLPVGSSPGAGKPAAGEPEVGALGPIEKTETDDGDRTGPNGPAELFALDDPQTDPQPVETPLATTKERAREVTRRLWEQRDPKPVAPFIAVAKIAERFLDAGHDDEALLAALLAAPTITTGAVEFALNRRGPSSRPNAPTQDRSIDGRVVI